jgi:1-deoxy-D-xylulose-5-phosphate synthase
MTERILDKIKEPADLRGLSSEQLAELAQEIRTEMVEVTSKNGGHLAPNLGVVELTIGLHLALDSPKDKILWDVGHQAYVHKLVTGRADRFSTLRQHGGLSGFPKASESPHDCFDTGHASNSISVALGMAAARDNLGSDETIVAVIGDGSMTGGIAYEALNHAGHLKSNLVVLLNDNEMSIEGNVGGLSCYLDRIRLDPTYNRLRDDIEQTLRRIPGVGAKMVSIGESWRTTLKQFLVPGMLFEELGIKYIGPIDGHDIEAVKQSVLMAKNCQGPILIHAITRKGRGYEPAERYPDRFHGTNPFDIETGEVQARTDALPGYGRIFGRSLAKLADGDRRIVAISAAMAQGTGLDIFAEAHPERFYDVGIAEQHAVTFAAGLAKGGLKPIVAVYSTFLQRAYDQLVQDICLQGLPVVFILDRAGLVGDDGPTHHGSFDLSYLSSMPEMVVAAPKDEAELQRLLGTALAGGGPFAIRFPRGPGPGVPAADDFSPLPIGKSEILIQGEQVAVLAVGRMVAEARAAVALLKKRGINCTLVNARFVKPIDSELISELSAHHQHIITVEDNSVVGGFGAMVSQLVGPLSDCRQASFGLPDCFVGHGPVERLFKEVGLDGPSLATRILAILKTHDKRTVRPAFS